MGYNHNRPLESFQDDLEVIRQAGFKPIAVTQMYFEDTFVFETEEEANQAFTVLETSQNKVCGWWHGREDFLKSVKGYEEDAGYKVSVLIHWL